jgi:hypothetical protein
MIAAAAPAAAAWIGAASAAAAAVGTAVSAVGQYQQAKQASAVNLANAQIAQNQADSQASMIRERAKRLAGSNRAQIGASGVDISGSFMDALTDNDISSELDAQTALWNGKVQGQNYRSQAAADTAAGQGALVSGAIGAGARALGGFGQWQYLNSMKGANAY